MLLLKVAGSLFQDEYFTNKGSIVYVFTVDSVVQLSN